MMLIAQFMTWGPDNAEYSVKLEGEQSLSEVNIKYSIDSGQQTVAAAMINFHFSDDTIRISMSGLEVAVTSYVACLIACGLGNIVQEMRDCSRKVDLLACLKSKGNSITVTLLNRSISCQGGIVVDSS